MASPGGTDIAYLVGKATLGLLLGFLASLPIYALSPLVLEARPSFTAIALSSAGIGAFFALVHSTAVWHAAESVLHFIAGFFIAIFGDIFTPNPELPLWLKVALWLGFAAACGLAVLFAFS